MGFSRQESWSGLPFPSPRNLPNPGIEPKSPALWDSWPLNHLGSPLWQVLASKFLLVFISDLWHSPPTLTDYDPMQIIAENTQATLVKSATSAGGMTGKHGRQGCLGENRSGRSCWSGERLGVSILGTWRNRSHWVTAPRDPHPSLCTAPAHGGASWAIGHHRGQHKPHPGPPPGARSSHKVQGVRDKGCSRHEPRAEHTGMLWAGRVFRESQAGASGSGGGQRGKVDMEWGSEGTKTQEVGGQRDRWEPGRLTPRHTPPSTEMGQVQPGGGHCSPGTGDEPWAGEGMFCIFRRGGLAGHWVLPSAMASLPSSTSPASHLDTATEDYTGKG